MHCPHSTWAIPGMGLVERKPVFGGLANNKGADQPTHPGRLISAFVIRFLNSIISNLATNEILIILLVSVTEETGLNLTLSETPKTGYVMMRPISRQTVQCNVKHTRLQGKLPWFYQLVVPAGCGL